jgi:hypothetical protein
MTKPFKVFVDGRLHAKWNRKELFEVLFRLGYDEKRMLRKIQKHACVHLRDDVGWITIVRSA